ncbi:MAG TPA: MFS transporter [Verrucomicrobiae bacterium]|nr:MFS transporter [Verrucomicrobiae bacterium]
MRGRDTWVLLATVLGSSLAFIDSTVVTLALPSIQREFHASAGDVAWIIELYTLVLGSLMLLGGALADRLGRKRTFVVGCTLFAAGSVGCAFAWSIPSILAARVLQGMGGMLFAPASLAILGAHFTGDARSRAVGTWSAFTALTSTLGPMLGGVLIDSLGWRSVFWINIPLAALVIAAALRHISESRDDNAPSRLDWLGAGLATSGLAAITYGLILASSAGWRDPAVAGSVIAGIAVLLLFGAHEGRSRAPLVPPDLFNSRTFAAINVATLLLYGATGGLFYETPFAMIQSHGYTALEAALGSLPMAIGLIALSRFAAPALAKRIGVRATLSLGPAIVTCGALLLALLEPQPSYWVAFFPGIAVVGIGMGITVAPLTNAVIGAATPRHVGIASGINTAVARVAALLAIAALTVVLAATYDRSIAHELDAIHAAPAIRAEVAAQRDRLGGAHFGRPQIQRASIDAFNAGYRSVAIACAFLAALAALADALGIDESTLR